MSATYVDPHTIYLTRAAAAAIGAQLVAVACEVDA